VSKRVVDQRRPEQAEDDERTDLYPFRNPGRHDCKRETRKDHLEGHKEQVRDAVAVHPDTLQEGVLQTPDQPVDVGAEGEAVAADDPLDADKGKCDERECDHRDEVLPAHEPSVEEPHSRGHQHDQCRTDQDKRRSAGVDHAPASRLTHNVFSPFIGRKFPSYQYKFFYFRA
jgi:hypothetical protein